MSTAAARQWTGAHVSSCTSGIVKDIGDDSCLIHLTQQTWHPATCTCFDIWRSIFVERGLVMMMRSSRSRNRILTACLKNSIWLKWGTFMTNVAIVLMWREIVLKNNAVVLPVSLVHHTELPNFLIAPRRWKVALRFWAKKIFKKLTNI